MPIEVNSAVDRDATLLFHRPNFLREAWRARSAPQRRRRLEALCSVGSKGRPSHLPLERYKSCLKVCTAAILPRWGSGRCTNAAARPCGAFSRSLTTSCCSLFGPNRPAACRRRPSKPTNSGRVARPPSSCRRPPPTPLQTASTQCNRRRCGKGSVHRWAARRHRCLSLPG